MKRQYSDTEKGAALAVLDANGDNLSLTARQTGIPRQTLTEWRDGRVSADVPDIRQVKKADLADRLEDLIHTLIDAMPGKVNEASLKDVATAAGIFTDKMQNLRGKPNVIIEDAGMSDEARADRAAAIFDAARERRAGQAPKPAPIH